MTIRFVMLAFPLVLVSAMPTLAQTTEPAARKSAAVADFYRICAPYFNYAGTPKSKEEWFTVDRRHGSGPYGLGTVAELQGRMNSGFDLPDLPLKKCAMRVAILHVQQGVPGYDHSVGGSTSPAPAASPRPASQSARSKPAPQAAPPAAKLPQVRPAPIVSRKSDADAKYDAEMRVYEQKLAARRKAVADFEAAQRRIAAYKAAAAARAKAADEEFLRAKEAHQAALADFERRFGGQSSKPVEVSEQEGRPVSAGGGPCAGLKSVGQSRPRGTAGSWDRYDYEMTNRCGVLVVFTLSFKDESTHEVRVPHSDEGAPYKWHCSFGEYAYQGNKQCDGGITGYSYR